MKIRHKIIEYKEYINKYAYTTVIVLPEYKEYINKYAYTTVIVLP